MTTIESSPSIDALRARVAGTVVAPGDADWDVARQAWNLCADQRPAAVVIPASADDVVAVVEIARAHGLRGVEIDPERRRVRAAAGTVWAEITGPASEHGLAPLSGSSPNVGVVGYTLGGGMSWLGRKLGLCADAVVAIELVTADGRVVRADAEHEADLFWALRGGGGSFGIVTAIELELFDVGQPYAGAMFFPAARVREVLGAWRELTLTAPDELTTSFRILYVPDDPAIPEPMRGGAFCVIDGAFIGDEAAAGEVLAGLRALEPLMDGWAPVAPAALSFIHMDPEDPMPSLSGSTMLTELTPEACDRIAELAGPGSGTPLMMIEVRHAGGALSRERDGQGARGAFDGDYVTFYGGVPMGPGGAEAILGAAGALNAALAPWQAPSVYGNFIEDAGDAARLFRPEAYARLQAIKAAVDPEDVIRANHPIPPA